MAIWTLKGDGKTLALGDVVAPHERLSWGKTIGLGAQHVVAMFGATFVFPLIMGLNPQLAIMMSGIATILFLLIVKGKVPSYLGTSASFVGAVAAIRAQEGATTARVTGAIMIAGLLLAAVGVLIHFAGPNVLHRVLPPAVTGAVVMLIGFNLAPVVAGVYWPRTNGGPVDDDLHHRLRRRVPRVHLPDRRLPCPHLWHDPLVGARQDERPNQLRPRRRERGN